MKKMIWVISATLILACGSAVKKDLSEKAAELTEWELWRIHRDVRYVYFHYDDGSVREGLLLRWKADSLLVQPRRTDLPVKIPAAGISWLGVETGTRVWRAFTIGAIAALAYAGIARSHDLSSASWTEAAAKLLGPPAILAGSVAAGSGWYEYRDYRLPDGFEFDIDEVKVLFEALE